MTRAGVLALALACTGCDKLLGLGTVSAPPTTAAYRKAITITQSTGQTLSDVPVSIALAADPDLVKHARGDGTDLAFRDDAGALDYELVAYSGGTLDAWVRVPSLPAGQSTIYLEYGGDPAVHDPTRAWRDSFAGVWHLSGPGGTVVDSTRHAHLLTAQGTPPAPTPGVVGDALEFAGASMERVCAGDSDGSITFDGATSFTFGAWVFVHDYVDVPGIPMHKGGSSNGVPGYDIELGNLVWRADLSDGVLVEALQATDTPPLDRWVDLAFRIDRGPRLASTFIDGALADTTPLTATTLTSMEPFCLGAETAGNQAFNGKLDEVRVVREAQSSAELAFAHANLAAPASVITVGSEQALTAP